MLVSGLGMCGGRESRGEAERSVGKFDDNGTEGCAMY